MKPDVKMGFWVGIGLLAALVIWHLVGRLAGGVLASAPAL